MQSSHNAEHASAGDVLRRARKLASGSDAEILERLQGELSQLPREAHEGLCRHAAELLARLGPRLGVWLERGWRECGHSAEGIEAFCALESARALQLLTELEPGARLETHRHPLELYAGAFLECPVQLAAAGSAAQRRADTHQEGRLLLEVPEVIDVFDERRDNRALLRACVLHRVGSHLFGTFDFRWSPSDAGLAGTPGYSPPPRPDAQGLGYPEFYASFELPEVARALFGLVEHLRIDGHLLRRYAGYRRDVLRLRARLEPSGASIAELLQTLSLGLEPEPASSLYQQALHNAMREAFALVGLADAGVAASAAATVRLWQILEANDLLVDLFPPHVETTETTVQRPEALEQAPPPRAESPPTEASSASGAANQTEEPAAASGDESQRRLAELLHGDLDEEAMQRERTQANRVVTLRQLQAELDERGRDALPPLPPELVEPDRFGVLSVQDGDLSGAAGLFLHDLDFLDQSTGESSEPQPPQLDQWSDEQLEEAAKELASRLLADWSSGAERPRGFEYDEWDHLIGDYRSQWCLLHERTPESPRSGRRASEDFVERTLERHRELLSEVRRQFELLKPEVYRRLRALADGDELDLDRLIEDAVDRRTGVPPSEQIYTRRERQERSVAAAFLVDMSASTDAEVPETAPGDDAAGTSAGESTQELPESHLAGAVPRPRFTTIDARFADDAAVDADPQFETQVDSQFEGQLDGMWTWPPAASRARVRRRVIDVEKEAIVLKAEALRTLGDEYAVYGFSGFGRRANDFYVAKEFADPYDDEVRRRIAALEPRQSTRMGPAIRHAVHKLQQTDAKIRALLVLSDGYPQDSDYGPERGDRTYGMQDTMMALREAEQLGIHTFCITVDPAGHDYLREMCSERRYLVIDDVDALPRELPKVYRGITS